MCGGRLRPALLRLLLLSVAVVRGLRVGYTEVPLTARELLSYGNELLPRGVISIVPDKGSSAHGTGAAAAAVVPPADIVTLSGHGEELPPDVVGGAPFDERQSMFTIISWWQAAVQLQAAGPAVALAPGQQLSLASLSLDLADIPRPLGAAPTLPSLALTALFRVPAGATLQLTNVWILLSAADMLDLVRSICSAADTDAWSYNPNVSVEEGTVLILDHTSRAPDEHGVAGEGGEVRWNSVQLLSAGFPSGPPATPLPCAARAVGAAWQLGAAGLQSVLDSVEGPIYLSLSADVALLGVGSESYGQVVVPPGRLLVVLGDPSLEQQRGRRTTFDLGGLEGAWLSSPGSTLARFRDLELVNLPYSSHPLEPYNLLAIGMQSFSRPGFTPTYGSSVASPAYEPNLRLAQCTLVVPDPELHFLSRAAVASTSGVGVPDLEMLFGAGAPQPRAGGDPAADLSEGRLVLEYLRVGSLVSLANVTLLSAGTYSGQVAAAAREPAPPQLGNAPPMATAYTATDEASPLAPLLASALVWPPLSLYDEQVALQWGGSGALVTSSLMDALLRIPACASTPSRRTVILLPSDPGVQSVTPLSAAEPQPLSVDGDRSPLSAAEECVVAGYPPALAGRRTFVNMQGAIGRAALTSPITLRDLVLYNLAPGGAYPSAGGGGGQGLQLPPAPQLLGADAVWANSSLPLWFFQCARSNEDLQQLLATAGSGLGADAGPPASPVPRLALANVTLVVAEAEWRALAAAVLLQHVPYSMQAAQQEPQGRRLQQGRYRRRLADEGEGQEVQAGASATAALLGFAAASRVASYNYTGGVLVLAEARWYGVHGAGVTVTHLMPDDAPVDATLLPYGELVLPYQELADLNIDFAADFSPPPPAPSIPPSQPPSPPRRPISPGESNDFGHHMFGAWSEPPSNNGDDTALLQRPSHPLPLPVPPQQQLLPWPNPLPPVPLLPSAARPTKPLAPPPPLPVPQPPYLSSELLPAGVGAQVPSEGGRPRRYLPAVVGVSAAGAVAVLGAAMWGVLAVRRRRQQHGHHKGGAGVAAAVPPKSEVSLGLAPGGAADPSTASCAASGSSALAPTAESPSASAPATSGGSAQQLPGLSGGGRGSGARAAPSAVRAPEAEVRAAVWGSSLVGLTLDLGPEFDADFSPRHTDEDGDAAMKRGFVRDLKDREQPEAQADAADSIFGGTLRQASTLRMERLPRDGAQLSKAIRMLQAELRDPDLDINSFLGRGACGAVYGGTWRGLPVAVKVLVVPGSGSANIRAQQRAVLEAAISLSMAHPNVVATYSYNLRPLVHRPPTAGPSVNGDIGTGAGNEPADADAYKLCIVQELCNGDTLGRALGAGAAGSIARGGAQRRLALQLAADVALGMAHVHRCRIVHGDLKPDNVLLVSGPRQNCKDDSTSDTMDAKGKEMSKLIAVQGPLHGRGGGGSGRSHSGTSPRGEFPGGCSSTRQDRGSDVPMLQLTAKVADFGLSLPLEAGATHASRCFHGTPVYSAPEVILEGRQSPQADVWSFGLMMLELYFGCSLPVLRAQRGALLADVLLGGATPVADGPQQTLDDVLILEMLGSPQQQWYAALAASCLHTEPHGRPPFEELAARLLEMLNDKNK